MSFNIEREIKLFGEWADKQRLKCRRCGGDNNTEHFWCSRCLLTSLKESPDSIAKEDETLP